MNLMISALFYNFSAVAFYSAYLCKDSGNNNRVFWSVVAIVVSVVALCFFISGYEPYRYCKRYFIKILIVPAIVLAINAAILHSSFFLGIVSSTLSFNLLTVWLYRTYKKYV